MEKKIGGGILSFDTADIHAVESLFHSNGFFWLTTAVATAVAAEEIGRFFVENENVEYSEQIISLFNQCICKNDINETEIEQAKQWSMDNLAKIDSWNRRNLVFQERYSLGISKGFTVYWLNYKLIELEWQQVLKPNEMEDIYQFLNQVLADSSELDAIEQAMETGQMNEDQRIFLRGHWQRSQVFWTNLYSSLRLLALGLIELRQPELTQ